MECAFCRAPAKRIVVLTGMKVCARCAHDHGYMRRRETVELTPVRSCGHAGRLKSCCAGCDDWYDNHVFS